MKATLIAWTHFDEAAARLAIGQKMSQVPWTSGVEGGEGLIEFAGRSCYESWTKPNPATATNEGYIRHLLDVRHLSVLEHAQATFYLTEVSRAFTHELVRHRHASYSQLSQRYVPDSGNVIIPDVINEDEKLYTIFVNSAIVIRDAYQQLMDGLDEKYKDEPDKTKRRKLARQAARYILPNATETKIVVTSNFRGWLEFFSKRATEEADLEIADVAVEILKQLQGLAPNVFGHLTIVKGKYGWYAESAWA